MGRNMFIGALSRVMLYLLNKIKKFHNFFQNFPFLLYFFRFFYANDIIEKFFSSFY